MDPNHSALLVGGPGAGKTSFLGRLWLSLQTKKGMLINPRLPENVEYLNAAANMLLKGSFPPHTHRGSFERVVIPIQSMDGKLLSGNLVVPDCSGEEWSDIYHNREWNARWEEMISSSCGCLLFVRADAQCTTACLDWEKSMELFKAPTPSSIPPAGEPLTPPFDVILVDWLQCLHQRYTDCYGGFFTPRVALVIAAWDLIPKDHQRKGVEYYIQTSFPLLSQFMEANGDYFQFSVFGSTATEGELADTHFAQSYLRGDPMKAGYVLHADGNNNWVQSKDFTLPVAWALGLNI